MVPPFSSNLAHPCFESQTAEIRKGPELRKCTETNDIALYMVIKYSRKQRLASPFLLENVHGTVEGFSILQTVTRHAAPLTD